MTEIELEVGPVAHGGHCVSRVDGRVVFVRHALPGERVRAVVTDERSSYLRADAVEILSPSPDRVTPPCPYAGPGRCGGCDFQHASGEAQLTLKASVVMEQLARLGGVTVPDLVVEPLPSASADRLLSWRTRVQYAVSESGDLGFRKHRSHEVVPVSRCLIASPGVAVPPAVDAPAGSAVEAVESSLDESPTVVLRRSRLSPPVAESSPVVSEWATGRRWDLPATAFWQVHPAAAATFAGVVLDFLAPEPGEHAWDLYGGVGLFGAVIADAVGPDGRVTVVESSGAAVSAGRANLVDLPQLRFVRADVERALANPRWRSVDLVVLDPPRSGAGRQVVSSIVARTPRAVVYVACDPAALGRDVRTFGESGYSLAAVRAFDAFPMTAHVETIALFTRR